MEAIKAACHNMSMDADYDTSVDNCKILIDMATKLYELYQQPNSIITQFSKWLLDSISKIITKGIENFQVLRKIYGLSFTHSGVHLHLLISG